MCQLDDSRQAYTSTPSFWLKTNTYREQPNVQYAFKTMGHLFHRARSVAPYILVSYEEKKRLFMFLRGDARPTSRRRTARAFLVLDGLP